ncbi:MAG: type IV pilus secretin PilQ, partial [gamma proteobacterium symbiont of Lucinoma myriamae]|nr:type IV pilus secretin PilQ [gamma proteobacterium symbiont of Lucinoma myriamae]
MTSDTVSGSITLRLKNVPWDQALAIILKTKGLGMREEGNVMRVAPSEEIAAIEKQELEAKKQIADLLPLVTETIQLQFVPASAVIALLDDMGATEASKNQASDTSGGDVDDEDGASYVSSRATIVGDDRTNKLIVRDTARNIAQLRKLIKEIDTPTRQVLIDSRIVSATDEFERDMGLNWSFGSTNSSGNLKNRGFPSTVQTTDGTVDLGVAQKNILGITFGLLNSSYLVDLEISASQVEGTSEVISSPRVVTTNGIKAMIKAGDKIPYQTVSDSGTQTEFEDAVLSLEVTPLIIPGNKINMELKINKDVDSGRTNDGQAIINKKEIETTVLVDNGDTIVLGGIFERNKTKSVDAVPVLGDIPVI